MVCHQQYRRRRRSRCQMMACGLFLALGCPMVVLGTAQSDLVLDWSKWDGADVPQAGADNASTSMGPEGCSPAQELRLVVNECAQRIAFPGNICAYTEVPVLEHDYQVPFMESGSLGCGFEERLEKETMEDLASRYTFYLIGDSTIRRLGESFVSIFTGVGSVHPVFQGNLDFSSGNLKVHFYWAPLCSGPESVGEVLKTVLNTAEDDDKRAVVVTAFGVHDAFELAHASEGHLSAAYESALPADVVAQDGMREAALGACRDTTVQVISAAAAAGTASILATAQSQGSEGGARRRTQARQPLRQKPGQRRRAGAKAAGNSSSSRVSDGSNVTLTFAANGASEVPASPPPLIFLLQNNRYPAEMVEDAFLEDVQQIQRQEVDAWEKTLEAAQGGIFLVNDSVSVFGNLSCFRNGNPIHFYEPVKLVEAKMLWDLLLLVDREESSLAARESTSDSFATSTCLASRAPRLSSPDFGVLYLGISTIWCTLTLSVWL